MKNFRFLPALLFTLFFCFPKDLSAQHDLVQNDSFFTVHMKEYQAWLDSNGLGIFFRTERLSVAPDKLMLYLTAAPQVASCDSLQATWEEIGKAFDKAHFHKQLFHEKLLETWSVMTELPTDSMEIIIRCDDPSYFNVRIYGEPGGRILADEQNMKALGGGIVKVPFNQLNTIHTGGRLDSLGRLRTVRKVRLAIGDYLLNHHYKDKGTPILYNVRIDTSASYYNEFTWEFTHLSNEVLKDEGYYEYHRIKIEVQDRNNNLEVTWQFTGKFGSGILFPPRRNDYKLMETYYREDEKEYEADLFKKITEYLQKKP
ncbi:MAG: hypothetical protein K9J37_22025 [Saprospiraceae bacterium]|nr:hypothetical protein [Saprospiraceae bacterium]MCF8252600.1 hypothetical protein [Saprospiraceae bacterium]MCF8282657.1 hypothetical protein [Bacteroidales bacterium]MCF8314075.1 hypothetical protein [Saprospiraceae bacterium]MCF8442941.1 hypothetical protein [Saprospiraceae bacterium]